MKNKLTNLKKGLRTCCEKKGQIDKTEINLVPGELVLVLHRSFSILLVSTFYTVAVPPFLSQGCVVLKIYKKCYLK